MRQLDLLGACVATAIFTLVILVFVARLSGRAVWEFWLGVALLVAAVPLCYLLLKAPEHHRSPLYYLQIGLMLAYLGVEFALDYAFKINFRAVPWMVIAYVTLFFAGTGGMIGVASAAGRSWTVSSVLLFLVMAILAFGQRAKLGTSVHRRSASPLESPMSVRVVRLGTPRIPGEGTRIGTVRRPPRGVPKARFSTQNWYDVWFPNLAPSINTVKLGQQAASPEQWSEFMRKYKAEMAAPEARHSLELLAVLSHTTNFSVGCYCQHEDRCHRSILRQLLVENGAKVE